MVNVDPVFHLKGSLLDWCYPVMAAGTMHVPSEVSTRNGSCTPLSERRRRDMFRSPHREVWLTDFFGIFEPERTHERSESDEGGRHWM
jgi:hypothetical protein